MNNQHRGLPPPMGMTLPAHDRGLPAMTPMGNLPAPPAQWTGQDESMRNWLQAKAEEDRRKAEEEKTRQEGLRLDQRKIEQNILRESLSGGIPPVMVPLIFAGMGGGALSTQTLEWAQHYMAQLSLQSQQQQQVQPPSQQQLHQPQIQQQQQPMSPDIRRDTRMIPPNPYGSQQQQLQPALGTAAPQSSQYSNQPPPPSNTARQPMPPIAAPRTSSSLGLSRLNTGELQMHAAPSQPTAHSGGQSLHSLQQSQSVQSDSQQTSAPGLFFHHWTPSAASTKSNQPPTPSGKSNQVSPFSQQQQSHLRSDYQNSPKKRKAAGGQPVPAPTSQPSETSPPFSSSNSSRERDPSPDGRNKGGPRRHSRQRSDASSTRDTDGRNLARPSSRQQRQDEISGATNPKRQDSGSTSGEDNQLRYGAAPETRASLNSAGPETRGYPTKQELET